MLDAGRLRRFIVRRAARAPGRTLGDVTTDRITIDPAVMDGQPCIRGLRFPVVSVVRMVAGGMSADEILADHPDLEAEDIPAALTYAAEALAEDHYPLRQPT